MAKPKLTREMITYIISLRDDVSKNYTFNDIEKILYDTFGVDISYKSIHKAYHKYKDNISHINVAKNNVFSDSTSISSDKNITDNIEPKSKNSDRLANILNNRSSSKGHTRDVDLDNFEMDKNLLNEIKGKKGKGD